MNKGKLLYFAAVVLLVTLLGTGIAQAEGSGPAVDWSPRDLMSRGDWWVIAGGGAPASGGIITLNDTLGQPVIGPAGGEGVTQGAGYWYGAPAVAPAVAPEVDIARTTGGAELTWTHIAANANGYEVWWSTAPYFSPGADGSDHATVTMPPWTYTHAGAPGVTYYYVVLGVNSAGQKSPISNRTGRFNFVLAPGN
jgi:hypothetical protein